MLKKSPDSLVAIDLAPDALRILDVSVRRGEPIIRAIGTETLPEGKTDTLPERHLEALKKLLEVHRIKTRNCVAAVPTSLVTTRSVMIDPSRSQTPEEQIKLTLQNILTYDARDLLFDYWKVTEPKNNHAYEVLVVACQRTVVHRYLNGFKKLKLACIHMDVAPCALAPLLAKLMPKQENMIGAVALGETMGYFTVVEKDRVLFWRPFELPPPKSGQHSGLERVGDEISKCVSHMVGSQHLDSLQEIVLFGNNSQDAGFASYLVTRFNLQVKAPSPFEFLPANGMPADLRTALQRTAASHYAAALGLVLQSASGGSHG
ncbi:MAG TPA: pilus assembly protein PilM [Phycisphaerae bacterium]|jgi:Tfp pilus assembly PilM family ATPase